MAKSLVLVTVLLAGTLLAFIAIKPMPVRADQAACEASGGTWAVIGTIPGTGQPEYSCSGCPEGTTGGASCTALSTSGPALILEPVDNEALGETHPCGDVQISINVECTEGENVILSYLGGVINFLAAGVGVVVVAVVTYSGVQYITSRGDPQKLSAAKGRLVNALIGLISFIFLYAFLQWLIPGGLFGGGGNVPPDLNDCTPGQPC